MKNKILVTGAGGYIASIATYLLLQKGYEVVAVDNFTTGYRQPLQVLQEKFGKNMLRWYEADLRSDLSPIFNEEKDIDTVLHYAACCIVDESMKDPGKYFHNNVGGTANLLKHMSTAGINKIIFSSTTAVYGESQYLPIDEKHPYNPVNAYGESKRMSEQTIEWFGQLKNTNYVIFRYFNVCGAADDGFIGDSKRPSMLLVQNAVRGALKIAPFQLVCPAVDTPDKTPIRDYINVVDLNEAHLTAIEYLLKGGKSEHINLGTGSGSSVMEIVSRVQENTGVKFDIEKGPTRQGDPAKLVASIAKAKEVLGWIPKRTIKDSIESLVKWYKQHPNGWEN